MDIFLTKILNLIACFTPQYSTNSHLEERNIAVGWGNLNPTVKRDIKPGNESPN